MAANKNSPELSLLRFSLWMGILFAVLGIGWGLSIDSGVILFDGIYSGFSIILSMLSIAALQIMAIDHDRMEKPNDDQFQFGRMAFEPLIVALKSFVIIAVCIYGIVVSVMHILHGGSTATNSFLGMLYAAISIAACVFSWLYLRTKGKGMPALVAAESEQWLIDTVFSSVVLVGFLASYLLSFTEMHDIVPYIDPGLVVLASAFFIRVPLVRFISSVRELLMMAPPSDIQETLKEKIDAIADAHEFDSAVVRSAKIGRELTLDIAFLVHPGFGKVDVAYLDAIRSEVKDSLAGLDYHIWMNVQFTKDRYWA